MSITKNPSKTTFLKYYTLIFIAAFLIHYSKQQAKCGTHCTKCIPNKVNVVVNKPEDSKNDDVSYKCVQCEEGFHLMKIGTPGNTRKECVQCQIPNCASCSPTPQNCHQCIRGFFNNSKPLVTQFQKIEKCSPCPENCDVCSSSNTCEICRYGYEF